jgi:hypothetical protein
LLDLAWLINDPTVFMFAGLPMSICLLCLQLVSAPDMPVAAAAVPAQAAPAMAEAVGAGSSAGPGIDEDLQVSFGCGFGLLLQLAVSCRSSLNLHCQLASSSSSKGTLGYAVMQQEQQRQPWLRQWKQGRQQGQASMKTCR